MGYDPRERLGRIRVRWVTALAGLALVPLLVVFAAVPYQKLVEARLSRAAMTSVAETSAGAPLPEVAARNRVRLLAFADGKLVGQAGEAVMSRWTNHVALRFVDPIAASRVAGYDAGKPAIGDGGASCALALDEQLLTCQAWGLDHAGRTIVAEAVAVRTISTLWGHRAPLLAVVLQMLLLAVALGLWLGRRTVGPIHRLREEVADRTQHPVSTEPVVVEGNDEVAHLAGSFNHLLGALEAQREANMNFLAEVAHELKTPIATIQQFADLVRALDDDRLQRPLEAVESSCQRLHVRTGELMELARASAGLPGLQREVVNLGDLVTNLTSDFKDVGSSPCDANVSMSTRYVEIALRNVLDNAVAHARSRVDVSMRIEGDEVVVDVRDDGDGIDDAELERVFERFHSAREGGTGLGLPMTRAVIRAHGGDAIARAGNGGWIELRLPVTPQS